MSLAEELLKPEYDGLDINQTYALLKSKYVEVVGKIVYGDTLHLVSMLARGLRTRIETCVVPELKAAWTEALHPSYLASPSYSINVGLTEIRNMLDIGLSYGVCTQEEHDFIIQLATYKQYIFSSTSLADLVAIKHPELLTDNNWIEIQTTSTKICLELLESFPEPSLVRIEVAYSKDGVNWSPYRRVNHFYNVQDVGFYSADIPQINLQTKVRVKGEVYQLTGNLLMV